MAGVAAGEIADKENNAATTGNRARRLTGKRANMTRLQVRNRPSHIFHVLKMYILIKYINYAFNMPLDSLHARFYGCDHLPKWAEKPGG
jgi:hypothetical protein